MYEVACWAGLPVKFSWPNDAVRYALALLDAGVRNVSVWNLDRTDPRQRVLLELWERRVELTHQLHVINEGTTKAAELNRRIAEIDARLMQA
jgi:hypothetical protein